MASRKSSDIIDLRALFRTYISKWYLFVISVIVCVGLGLLFTRVYKTKYGVRANILIQQEGGSPLAAVDGLGDLFGTSAEVDDEIFVLSSHSLYRDVVRDLGLNRTHYVRLGFLKSELSYPKFPIDVTAAPALADTLREVLTFKIKVNDKGLANIKARCSKEKFKPAENVKLPYAFVTPYGTFNIVPTQYYHPGKAVTTTVIFSGYHKVAEDLALEISSEIANKKSNVIEMGINTPNPEMGEAILQNVIDKYNERGIRETNLQGQKTAEFLENRLILLDKELQAQEEISQTYRESQGMLDVKSELTYQTERKGMVEKQLIESETELEILKMTYDFMTRPDNHFELVPMAVESAGLQKSIAEYNELILERSDMLSTGVREDNQLLQRVTAQINATRENLANTIRRNYVNKEVAVKDLRQQMSKSDARIQKLPGQLRSIMEIDRRLHVQQSLYTFLLERQEENAILMANAVPKGTIVDVPYTLNKPIGLTNKIILLIALILGIILVPIYLYVMKLLRNRVESRSDIETRTDAPILGEMCTDTSGQQLVVTSSSTSASTELFRLMRANLLFVLNDANDRVVLLTSSTSGEGKSFISINLAASLALLGKKVLLIGMDIRAPRLADYLDIRPQFGLTQYLSSSDIALDRLIVHHPIADLPSMDVIVAGPVPPNPAELLTSSKVDEMFATLRGMYDYIIVDSAPVGMVSDTFTLNRISDATVYVTRLNSTDMHDIDFIQDIYVNKRLKKVSVVVNGVKGKKTYGYGHKSKK